MARLSTRQNSGEPHFGNHMTGVCRRWKNPRRLHPQINGLSHGCFNQHSVTRKQISVLPVSAGRSLARRNAGFWITQTPTNPDQHDDEQVQHSLHPRVRCRLGANNCHLVPLVDPAGVFGLLSGKLSETDGGDPCQADGLREVLSSAFQEVNWAVLQRERSFLSELQKQFCPLSVFASPLPPFLSPSSHRLLFLLKTQTISRPCIWNCSLPALYAFSNSKPAKESLQ